MWAGKSRLEYCLDKALRSPSFLPRPPRAGSKVGRAAVVMPVFQLYEKKENVHIWLEGCKIYINEYRYDKKEIIKISKQAEHGKPASGIIDICIVENPLWLKNVEVDLLKTWL